MIQAFSSILEVSLGSKVEKENDDDVSQGRKKYQDDFCNKPAWDYYGMQSLK